MSNEDTTGQRFHDSMNYLLINIYEVLFNLFKTHRNNIILLYIFIKFAVEHGQIFYFECKLLSVNKQVTKLTIKVMMVVCFMNCFIIIILLYNKYIKRNNIVALSRIICKFITF